MPGGRLKLPSMNILGQVFTRADTASQMAKLFSLPNTASLLDPCCGAGVFLEALAQLGYSRVAAYELDPALHGLATAKFPQFQIVNMDFLASPGNEKYDGVIMNPPYIRHEKIDNLASLGITKKSLRSREIFRNLRAHANMYMYFTIRAIELLKDNGQLVVIFPSSWMNSRTGSTFKKLLLAQCDVDQEIHIDGPAFEGDPLVKTVIMKLIKKGASNSASFQPDLECGNTTIPSMLPLALTDLATMRRGLTTFCNEMFINPPIADAPHIKEIISSPRQLDGYSTTGARLDRILYPAGVISEEIEVYLANWKKRILASGKPRTLYRKINSGMPGWYCLPPCDHAGILFGYAVRERMKFVLNERGIVARDNFLVLKPAIDVWLLFALLNNYYTFWQLENAGKLYGGGILKLQAYDLAQLRFPDTSALTAKERLRELAMELAQCGDPTLIAKITQILADHYPATYDEICAKYFQKKSQRLHGAS